MNKPVEPIFATRSTVTIELPLGKNTRLLHPEHVILKIGPVSHDLGALCYSLRSSKMRKPGQPRGVVIGSLLKQRPKEILQLIKALSRLVQDDGKSLITVGNYAHQLKSFLDWSDSNGLHDCLSGGEATRNAYRAWVTETRERYLRQEFGQRAHNDRLDFIRELLEAATGLEALGRGIGKVKERWNPNGGTEPLAPHDFAHGVALNQALFDGLCDLVLEQRPFPYKLELPGTLGWEESHLWLFPINQWHLPPHQWGAEREKLGKQACWAYDYANGRLATPDAIAHRYATRRYPSQQREDAKEAIKRAQARIDTANADVHDRHRTMLGIIAHKAFLFLFFCNTAANESVTREIETNGEVDAATSNQQFRSIKFRASGKSVTLTVPAAFMPSLRRFMELRRYLLQGKNFPYLFFTFGPRNENPPTQIGYSPLASLYENQLRALDSQLPRMPVRKLRASVADWYQRHHDASVTAKVLQNTEQTAQKRYDSGSATDHREELSLFLTSVSESARRQRVIAVKAEGADAPPLEEGGRCDSFGHPESLADNAPVKPDCKDSQGCLFCKRRVLVACEEDARKVASAAFVMEQVILGPLHEAALRPLIAKCDEDLEKIANFRNCRAMVVQVRKDVFENGNLTPFFADKYQLFLELGSHRMKIEARIEQHGAQGPDPWDDDRGICLPLDHVICRDVDGTPHTVGEFVWPWTAYTAHRQKFYLHFFYWKQTKGRAVKGTLVVSPEREARIRELQFLMTRLIYYGNENAPITLDVKLRTLHHAARFAEARSCMVRDVLTQTTLLDACGASLPDTYVAKWMGWLTFLGQIEPETQLGFTLATPKQWKDLERRVKEFRNDFRQHAPLPTRIYAALINNLAAELDDIEAHKPRLLAALREAIVEHRQAKAAQNRICIGPALVEKHGLAAYLGRRGFTGPRPLMDMASAIGEIFLMCKLQIHVFSGMRNSEARHLPYHCMSPERGLHGRKHCLIAGATTKFNNGRRLRTKWVTTERDGFRAIRLAQEFAAAIYEDRGVMPSKADDLKDEHPLFPSVEYLPWMQRQVSPERRIAAFKGYLGGASDSLLSRLCPAIEEEDIAELEEIDPFRAWCEEPEFGIGRPWPLTTHQLRRSLAVYANASGLVRLSSLRRQLQHITREMTLYYGRGSTFCKNFIEDDPKGYNKHVAVEWQDGAEEAEVLAFVRDVLHSKEQMFGGAGNYYDRQRERGEVMAREEVARQMKAGLLAYREGPLGGCTRPGVCETRKGLNLIDTVCATDGCKHLIGKHSKIVQTIRLKRAAMAHITPGSVTAAMEREELEALERMEREWRPQEGLAAAPTGDGHA